jgi:hypothetical protein
MLRIRNTGSQSGLVGSDSFRFCQSSVLPASDPDPDGLLNKRKKPFVTIVPDPIRDLLVLLWILRFSSVNFKMLARKFFKSYLCLFLFKGTFKSFSDKSHIEVTKQ